MPNPLAFFKKTDSTYGGNHNDKKYDFESIHSCYPLDILSESAEIDKAIKISAYSYSAEMTNPINDSHGTNNKNYKTNLKWSCYFPIPSIQESESQNYTSYEGFGLGESLQRFKEGALNNSFTALRKGDVQESLKQASSIISPVLVRAAYKFLNEKLGDEMALYRQQFFNGDAINPLQSLIYNNSNLKQYQFNFSMIARDRKETEQIDQIVKNFKRFSRAGRQEKKVPGIGDIITDSGISFQYLTHPCLWRIEFCQSSDNSNSDRTNHVSNYMPKIKTCVLENIGVQYSGAEPHPVFFRDTNAPVEYMITLSFTELFIQTSDDVI